MNQIAGAKSSAISEDPIEALFGSAAVIASERGHRGCTGHLLLALAAQQGPVQTLLAERGLSFHDCAGFLVEADPASEHEALMKQVRKRCNAIRSSIATTLPVSYATLPVLIALTSAKQGVAQKMMFAANVDMASLRSVALALATGGANSSAVWPHPKLRDVRKQPQEVNEGGGSGKERMGGDVLTLTWSDSTTPARPQTRRPGRRGLVKRANDADPRVTHRRTRRKAQRRSPYDLDPKRFPLLSQIGHNLSAAAASGHVEPLLGRRAEIRQMLDVLGKRRANSPCLVGEPGVGKTAIVHGLAHLQIHHAADVPSLTERTLVAIQVGKLLAGTHLRGAFSERMAALRNEVHSADGRIVLVLDDIHTFVGAGAADAMSDALSELSDAIERGGFPCISTTTTENFRRYLEPIATLRRRLQPILITEPTPDETVDILRGVAAPYATHHAVAYADSAFAAAARFSQRYITDRFLPEKAVSLLDLAGSRARRSGINTIEADHIAELVAEIAQVPKARLLMTDTERFFKMEQALGERVIGHADAIARVAQVIRRNYAGFGSDRPIGSFLFLGPTGVGKTQLVKALADFMFQNKDAMCRLDMSEFSEPHSVARMIGSPPGYVGFEQGGQLTESVRRRPYQIVLLDEVEKAHPEVLQVLLQLLDDGRLTDGRGRTVDFSHTLVVMTSNLGSEHYERTETGIGFSAIAAGNSGTDPMHASVLRTARRAFPPELWNRIEERLVFNPLDESDVFRVAKLLIESSSNRLNAERGISYTATDAAISYLIDNGGYDRLLGARPMRGAIQRHLETEIAERILAKNYSPHTTLVLDRDDSNWIVREIHAKA